MRFTRRSRLPGTATARAAGGALAPAPRRGSRFPMTAFRVLAGPPRRGPARSLERGSTRLGGKRRSPPARFHAAGSSLRAGRARRAPSRGPTPGAKAKVSATICTGVANGALRTSPGARVPLPLQVRPQLTRLRRNRRRALAPLLRAPALPRGPRALVRRGRFAHSRAGGDGGAARRGEGASRSDLPDRQARRPGRARARRYARAQPLGGATAARPRPLRAPGGRLDGGRAGGGRARDTGARRD